jgi:uncharacterized membrane protein YgcG
VSVSESERASGHERRRSGLSCILRNRDRCLLLVVVGVADFFISFISPLTSIIHSHSFTHSLTHSHVLLFIDHPCGSVTRAEQCSGQMSSSGYRDHKRPRDASTPDYSTDPKRSAHHHSASGSGSGSGGVSNSGSISGSNSGSGSGGGRPPSSSHSYNEG